MLYKTRIGSFSRYLLLPGVCNGDLIKYMVLLNDSKWDREQTSSHGVLRHP